MMPAPLPVNTIPSPTADQLDAAIARLKAGELVAFPTETVYGLGADASNPAALEKLYSCKGRPGNHPVIVHLGSHSALSHWAAQVPPQAEALAQAFWPGPLTMILPKAPHVLPQVTGGQDTVGLRMPSHPVALALLQAFGGGVAAPSANRFGRISPTTAAHVQAELGTDDLMILDGGSCQVGLESTIVDLTGPVPIVLRPGAITPAQIQAVVGTPVMSAQAQENAKSPTRVPGSLARHYAPNTPTRLMTGKALRLAVPATQKPVGVLTHSVTLPPNPLAIIQVLPAMPKEYAHQLYAALHQLDRAEVSEIWVEAVPEGEAWQAVADRLKRAALPENMA